jgi:transglutaminase-like putative cysteine protease
LAVSIWSWLRTNVRYHEEWPHVVASLGVLTGPAREGGRVGDCNDYAVAVAALAKLGRVPARWALGYNRQGEPCHIWAQLWDGHCWLDVDPSPGAPRPGDGCVIDAADGRVVAWVPISVEDA